MKTSGNHPRTANLPWYSQPWSTLAPSYALLSTAAGQLAGTAESFFVYLSYRDYLLTISPDDLNKSQNASPVDH